MLNAHQEHDLLARGVSRRSFGRIAALLSAGATLPFGAEPTYAQLSNAGPIPADAVKINANENPHGPCPEAADAIQSIVKQGGRYHFEITADFSRSLAASENLKPSSIRAYAGSTDALRAAVLAFTSPQKSLVGADPGYEFPFNSTTATGAKAIKVPLTPAYGHDVKAMVAADANAGLYYVCNPNNPTGTLTPRADIEWLVANKPRGSVVLIDEAYVHFCDAPRCTDLVSSNDVVVLRTFSKLYGMAGLRAGAAIARPDLLQRMTIFSGEIMPITGMQGALASLNVGTLIPQRRALYDGVRQNVFEFLKAKNIEFIPSVSNCFMVNVKQPAKDFAKAMQAQNVYVGRAWPIWPAWSRITIGTQDEMDRFKTAAVRVLAV